MPLTTPVALLIFNRPETTRRVFQKIAEARPKKLLVIADGPRSADEKALCEQTRAVVERVDWDCEVFTDFADRNMGCKQRVSSGLDWVFRLCDEAIILEDDCVPHPDFFGFCAEMLERYRADERIMMVAGMNYFRDGLRLPESYTFSRYFPVWGWATWRRAWEKYDRTMAQWPSQKAQRQLQAIYGTNGLGRYCEMLFDSATAMDTWDIAWVYSCVFQNGLSVIPPVNLVSNIGVVGTHSSREDGNHNLPTSGLPPGGLVHPAQIFPNALYDERLARQVLLPLVPSPFAQSFRQAGRRAKRWLRSLSQRRTPSRVGGKHS